MTTPNPIDDQLRATLGEGYELQRELTGGGMSRVFVAIERALNREVVVKVLPPELAAGVNRDRFKREIQVAAQLQHPHIVPLHTAGHEGDVLYYTMPFIAGESLKHAIERGDKFSVREALRILHDVVDAVAYAHERGVIHRDIKPANVLRSGAHAVVTDFGVAKAISAALPAVGMTTSGMAIGTPAYMAPEQLAGDPAADHRMDIYAIGLLAYELLTGEAPFSGASPQETMAAQLTRSPAPISRTRRDVPEALAKVITQCLAKDPAQRPQTARQLYTTLDELTAPSGDYAPLKRGRRSSILIGAGVAVAAIGAFFVWRPRANVADISVLPTVPTVPAVTPALTHADSVAIAKALAPKPPVRPKTDSTKTAPQVAGVKPTALGSTSAKANTLPSGITPFMDSVARVGQILATERPDERTILPDAGVLSREAFAERLTNMGALRPTVVLVHSTPGRPGLDSVGVDAAAFLRRTLNQQGPARFAFVDVPPLRAESFMDSGVADSVARALHAEVVVALTPNVRRDSMQQWTALVHDVTANAQYETRTAQGRWRPDSALFGMSVMMTNVRRSLDQMDHAPRRDAVDPVRKAFTDRAATMGPARRVVVANHAPDRNPAMQEAGSQVMDIVRHSLTPSKRFAPVRRDSTLSALEKTRDLASIRTLLSADIVMSIRAIPAQADSIVWLVSISDATAVRPFDQRSVTSARVAASSPLASIAPLVAQILNSLEVMDRAPRIPAGR